MPDLSTQLADLNINAKELLNRYDGAFSKIENLSKQKQQEISQFVDEKIKEIKENSENIDIDAIKKEIDDKVKSAVEEINETISGKSLNKTGLKKVLLYKLGSDITASSGVTTKIPFDTEVFNTFDTKVFDSENKEFVIPFNGVYAISSSIRTSGGASGEYARTDLAIFINGSAVIANGLKQIGGSGNNWGVTVNGYLNLNAGDRVTIYYNQNKGTDMTVFGGDINGNTGGIVSYINIAYLGGE